MDCLEMERRYQVYMKTRLKSCLRNILASGHSSPFSATATKSHADMVSFTVFRTTSTAQRVTHLSLYFAEEGRSQSYVQLLQIRRI